MASSSTALERLREPDLSITSASARAILRPESVSDLPWFDRLLSGRGVTARVAQKLQLAGQSITPGSFFLRVALAAASGLLLSRMVSGTMAGSVLFTLLGAMVPVVLLHLAIQRRVNAFQEQLPDAIDMMVSSMKAGYSFQAAMKFIGEEIPAPLGPEFGRFYEEQRLGLDVRTALLSLQERVDSLDLRMLVTAILIQRETGGNLGEVLEKISSLMRERSALKGEIETLTAESKLSARILGALPFVVFGAVNLLNPGFMRPMLETTAGPWVMAAATLSVLIGYWLMMRLADIDI
ncbi:MAG: type II secretion system F family protein [Gemmatimonadaceae bacterium]